MLVDRVIKLCNDNNLNLLNLIFQGNIVKAKCQLHPVVHDEQKELWTHYECY